jgi:uncharacterized protein YggE
MKKILLLCLALCSTPLSLANTELKGNPEELRKFLHPTDNVITIQGSADEKAYSDNAIVSLVIVTEDKRLSDALSKNSELRASITKQLLASGMAGDKIKSSKFSTSPQYGWFGKKPDSYKVVNRMAITITDELHLKEIARVADNNKDIELTETVFEHSKKEELKNKVKADALNKVMKQKAFYESSLGVKLIPIGFRDVVADPRATSGARGVEEIVVTAMRSNIKNSSFDYDDAYDKKTPSFDEVQYEATIYVDFKIDK